MSRVKILTMLSIVAVMMAVVVPVAHAGVLWTGIDPIFKVKDRTFNVVIKWHPDYTCSIEDPIDVKVRVPKDSSYVFIAESSDDVGDCGSPQRTLTKVKFVKGGHVKVKAKVKSEHYFPVMVEVYLDGELVSTRMGASNRWTRDAKVEVDDDDDDDRDDRDDRDDDDDDDDRDDRDDDDDEEDD